MTLPLFALDLLSHSRVDCKLEDFVDSFGFFAATFDVNGTHSSCDGLALFGCHGCQALAFEEVDAGALGAQVGFEANEDERGCGAEMEDFGIPLWMDVRFVLEQDIGIRKRSDGKQFTLSMTFSSELGQSMAKQTKRRSVSGYERGRRRSYSSWPAVSHNANSTVLPVGWWVVWVM